MLNAQLLLRPSTESGQLASAVGSSAPDSADKPCTLPSTKGYEGEARGNLTHGSALKTRCECPDAATSPMESWYAAEERKAMRHAPNACPGDYELRQYRRGDATLWLCSCCCMPSDIDV